MATVTGTTRAELREALQRLYDAAMGISEGHDLGQAALAAGAILARPAVVVGYRVRTKHGTHVATWKPDIHNGVRWTLEQCRLFASDRRDEMTGGKLYRLVRR